MAFKAVKNQYLKINSVRQANWFYYYLELGLKIQSWQLRDTPERKAQSVLEALSFEIQPDGTKTQDYANEMVRVYNYTVLQDDELRWIKRADKRQVFWLWCYLQNNLHHKVQLYLDEFKSKGQLPDVPDIPLPLNQFKNYRYNFNHQASTHTERYEAIINALDTSLLGSNAKVAFNSQLKIYWEELLRAVPKLNWLKTKSDEAERALSHLLKLSNPKKKIQLPIKLRLELARLSDQNEKAFAIQAIVDFFYTDLIHFVSQQKKANAGSHQVNVSQIVQPEVTKLVDKMRNAFDERMRRERLRKEKLKNLRLSNKAQSTLDMLVILKKQKSTHILQELLEAELNRYLPAIQDRPS